MKKVKVNRTITMIILMMFITVTYASFNTNLFIDGKAYLRVDKDIRITNIHLVETEYNGYENTESEYTNHSVSTDVSLPRQASSLTYDVTISNVSDKRYKITDILEEAYDNKDVKYELINASIGNIVEPHTEKTFQIKFTNNTTVVEEDDVYETKTYTFDYTGDVQEFVVPFDGTYKIELWGAEGGNHSTSDNKGAYTSGTINLRKNEKLYVYVGQGGSGTTSNKVKLEKRFNGGGETVGQSGHPARQYNTGGGSTDIRTMKANKWDEFQSLKSRIMVAAGGGGTFQTTGDDDTRTGGAGGGLIGYNGSHTGTYGKYGSGGTQTSGGYTECMDKQRVCYTTYGFQVGERFAYGSFGIGGTHYEMRPSQGGGGGYFGGGGSEHTQGGGGGSSYISGHAGCVAVSSSSTKDNIQFNIKNGVACSDGTTDIECSYHYSDKVFTNTKMVDGRGYEWTTQVGTEVVGMPTYDGTSTMTGNEGNGYAKITVTRKIENGSEYNYDFTNGEQTFVTPYSGKYLLETWGAQGGASRNGTAGGYGGYSSGFIELAKNTTLYIYNGGKGSDAGDAETTSYGGYNGGGNSTSKNASDTSNWGAGGGATHIGLESGLLSIYSDNTKLSNLLIVAGAGGGAGSWKTTENVGGSGGGFIGNQGTGEGFGTGGTQSTPGLGDSKEKTTDNGHFGQGGNYNLTDWGAGGGSGYYGGGVGYRHGAGAGGGSGYIGNSALNDKVMYCYNCQESQDTNTKTVSTLSHSLKPKQNTAKEENGYSRITLLKRTINQTKLTLDFSFEEYVNGNEYIFGYTGESQTFTATKTGYYQVELWGAGGGRGRLDDSYFTLAGKGSYTSGKLYLRKGETIYVYVGQSGIDATSKNNTDATFNGGGAGSWDNVDDESGGSGGGATDIRLVNGNWNNDTSLNSRIMVAGGGAGIQPTWRSNNEGYNIVQIHGGGVIGEISKIYNDGTQNLHVSQQGSQTTGYAFGVGQSGLSGSSDTASGGYTSGLGGAGGGYYGGLTDDTDYIDEPGGGSSYISGHTGCIAIESSSSRTPRNDTNGVECVEGTSDNTCSKHYSNYIFTNTEIIDGEGYSWTNVRAETSTGMPTHDGTTTMTGNSGDGFAKITLVEEIPEYHFDYSGAPQEFVAPYNGIYKVELWGASGGAGSADKVNYIYPGGKGAYTSGNIELSKNQKLYLYVGKEGDQHAWNSEELSPSSWNGGGAGGFDASTTNTSDGAGSGGGATDIRLTSGQWNNFDGLKSRIMVAAGGGGGSWPSNNLKSGQNASGLYVKGLEIKSHNSVVNITDGTQFSGYKFGVGKDGEPDAPNAAIGGDGGGYWTGVYDATMRNGIGGTSYISGHQGCVSISESSIEDNISFVNDSNGVSCGSDTSLGYNASGYNTDSLCSNHYSDMEFYDTSMIDGAGHPWTASGSSSQVVEIPSHDGRTTMVGNTGNGYAKITLLQKSTDVVRDNLLLYLDAKNPGNTEGVWEDKSGNGFNGTIIDGNFNQNALKLNSSTSGVFMGDQLIDLFKDNFTLEIYLNSTDTDSRGIVMGNHPRDGGHSMSIERGSSGGLDYKEKGRFYFNESNPNYVTTANYIKNGKQQLFFIFDKDNNKVIFGKNGQVVEEYSNSAFEGDFDFNNSYLFRDKREGATTYKCEAYSVRLYNRAVSLNELKSNYIYDKIYYK